MTKRNKTLTKKRNGRAFKGHFILYAILSSLVGIFFLRVDNTVDDSRLTSITVTLSKKPRHEIETIKWTTYRSLILNFKNYKKDFEIGGKEYSSLDFDKVNTELNEGDEIWIKILKEDFKHLNKNTFINNFNNVFDLGKESKSFIDLDKKRAIKELERRPGYIALIVSIISLIYYKLEDQIKISYHLTIIITVVISFLFLYDYF